jgi:hypothetical protein
MYRRQRQPFSHLHAELKSAHPESEPVVAKRETRAPLEPYRKRSDDWCFASSSTSPMRHDWNSEEDKLQILEQ